MAAGLHRDPEPSIEDVYEFCVGLSRSQAQEMAERARSWVAYVRSLDGTTADVLCAVLENAAKARLAMGG